MKRVKILETIKDCGVPIWKKGEIYEIVGGDQTVYYLTTEQSKYKSNSPQEFEDTICGIDVDSNKDIIEVLGGE